MNLKRQSVTKAIIPHLLIWMGGEKKADYFLILTSKDIMNLFCTYTCPEKGFLSLNSVPWNQHFIIYNLYSAS